MGWYGDRSHWEGAGRNVRIHGYLTSADAAAVLGVSLDSFYSRHQRELKSRPSPAGGKWKLFKESDVLDLGAKLIMKRGLKAMAGK